MPLSDDQVLAGKHIFIVGTAMSGSTVLYRSLAHHPDLAWFSQYSNRDWTIPDRFSFPFSHAIDMWGRRLFVHPWSKWTSMGFFARTYHTVIPAPWEGQAAWTWVFPRLSHRRQDRFMCQVAEGNIPAYTREHVPEIRDRLIALVRRALTLQNKTRFLAKRPHLCFVVPAIAGVLPNAKFIHAVRDGKACAVSRALRTAQGAATLEWVRLAAKEWRETMRFMATVEREIGSKRLICVRYEDYCADVRSTVSMLLEFCDLRADQRVRCRLPAQIHSTNSRRIAETPDEQRRAIMDIAGEELRARGYAGF